MARYRKKPIVVEAVQLPPRGVEPSDEVIDFMQAAPDDTIVSDYDEGVAIETLEGVMRGDPEDYIIKGVNGEYYPCKPDIFEKTYEKVD